MSIFARGNPCQQSKNSIAPLHCIRHTPAQHQPHNLCHVDIVTFVQQRAGLGQRRRRKSWGEIKSFLNVSVLNCISCNQFDPNCSVSGLRIMGQMWDDNIVSFTTINIFFYCIQGSSRGGGGDLQNTDTCISQS